MAPKQSVAPIELSQCRSPPVKYTTSFQMLLSFCIFSAFVHFACVAQLCTQCDFRLIPLTTLTFAACNEIVGGYVNCINIVIWAFLL